MYFAEEKRDRALIIAAELACPLSVRRNANHVDPKETRFSGWFPCQQRLRRIRLANRSGLGRRSVEQRLGDGRRSRKREEGSATGRRIGKEGTTSRFEHPVYTSPRRRGTSEHAVPLYLSLPTERHLLSATIFFHLSPLLLSSRFLPSDSNSLTPRACSPSVARCRFVLVAPLGQACLSLALCKVKRSSALGRWPQLAVTQCER